MFNDVFIWIEFVYYFGNFVSNLLLKDYCYYKVDFVIYVIYTIQEINISITSESNKLVTFSNESTKCQWTDITKVKQNVSKIIIE